MAGRQVIFDQPGGTLSTIAAFLKEDYVTNEIRSLVNTSTEFLSRIKTKGTDNGGLGWVEPLKTAISQGSGARAENSPLPNPGFGVYDRITGNVKSLYGVFYITGQAIAGTKSSKSAFKSALTKAMEDCKEGFRVDLQRQAWGDGSAILGRVAANSSGTVVQVSDPYGLDYVQSDLQGYEKVMPYGKNMEVWIYTEGGGGTNLFRRITLVSRTDGTVTLNTAATVLAGDIILRGSAATNNSDGNEITGISGFVKNTGMYFNLDRTGEPVLQSEIIESSGDPLTMEDEMDAMSDAMFRNGTDDGETLIFGNTRVFSAYRRQLRSERRQVNPTVLKSGQKALEYDGITFVRDKDCPPQRMYWLKMNEIFWRQMGEEGWIDDDGSVLKQAIGADGPLHAFNAFWCKHADLVTRAPMEHGMIEGITFTDTSV